MSRRTDQGFAEQCVAVGRSERRVDAYPSRELSLGALSVSRALPIREKRMVGPWCFLDRFGPLTFEEGKPMDVAPHPHIGLQTVTWLLGGEIAHDDSLGFQSVLRPGGVNVMTSGAGIAHAEQTPRQHTGRLDGAQLWVALPDEHRQMDAGFAHLEDVPAIEWPGGIARVFSGRLPGVVSPAPHYSDLVGADLQVHARESVTVPLEPSFEHAVLVLGGDCAIDGQSLEDRTLYYLGSTRADASFSSRGGARLLLVGGPPFPESILMWWNFVARTPEEIADARADWEARRRFGDVRAYDGPRLPAPELLKLARANPVS